MSATEPTGAATPVPPVAPAPKPTVEAEVKAEESKVDSFLKTHEKLVIALVALVAVGVIAVAFFL